MIPWLMFMTFSLLVWTCWGTCGVKFVIMAPGVLWRDMLHYNLSHKFPPCELLSKAWTYRAVVKKKTFTQEGRVCLYMIINNTIVNNLESRITGCGRENEKCSVDLYWSVYTTEDWSKIKSFFLFTCMHWDINGRNETESKRINMEKLR